MELRTRELGEALGIASNFRKGGRAFPSSIATLTLADLISHGINVQQPVATVILQPALLDAKLLPLDILVRSSWGLVRLWGEEGMSYKHMYARLRKRSAANIKQTHIKLDHEREELVTRS